MTIFSRFWLGMAFDYGVLFALIAAKLTGILDLSWIWVLAPLWLPILVVLCGMTVFFKLIDRWLK